MTPFAMSPDLTLKLITHAQDEQTRLARRHAAVRRAARKQQRRRR